MASLYPLSFCIAHKDCVWGSESLLLSALPQTPSLVENGFLAGNDLPDVVETYLTDLLGEEVYNRYGEFFPLLVKILNVEKFLSVQVHPDDAIAINSYDSLGKSEMWYIMEAKPEAYIYLGFNQEMDASKLIQACREETLPKMLNCIRPKAGDCFFIPAGTVHACGGGLRIAEVQESSDITFRLYDWGREHNPQTARKMHIEEALDCINYHQTPLQSIYSDAVVQCDQFVARKLVLEASIERDNSMFYGSSVIYICLKGSCQIECLSKTYPLTQGSCLLIPAAINHWSIKKSEPQGADVMEVYVPQVEEKY